jgi:TetR/AcrR family transcriptional repressor of nem operon
MIRSEKARQIIDVGEKMVRRGGYNNLSFREIASAVGVKSASVHYHFPTKADLAKSIAEQYSKSFLEALGDPTSFKTARDALDTYIDAYRSALVNDNLMCLCGIMGAEVDILPEEVRYEAKSFFDRNIKWLSEALASHEKSMPISETRERAVQIIATLEGALLMSRTMDDQTIFELAAKAI